MSACRDKICASPRILLWCPGGCYTFIRSFPVWVGGLGGGGGGGGTNSYLGGVMMLPIYYVMGGNDLLNDFQGDHCRITIMSRPRG